MYEFKVDQTTLELMREYASLQGKRDSSGNWTDAEPKDLANALTNAVRIQLTMEMRVAAGEIHPH